jgi:hypothetical protein
MDERESNRDGETAPPAGAPAEPANGEPAQPPPPRPRSIADRLRAVIGAVDGLPPDFAKNHDHYIHGTPKR